MFYWAGYNVRPFYRNPYTSISWEKRFNQLLTYMKHRAHQVDFKREWYQQQLEDACSILHKEPN